MTEDELRDTLQDIAKIPWDADCGHVFEFSEITTRRRSEARFSVPADSFRATGGFA